MAYTVWGAFDWFRKNIVDLDPDQTKTARKSRDNLCSELKALSDKKVDFPRLTGSCQSFGSFSRRTKIRPLDDIDLLVILNGRDTRETSTSTAYQYWLYLKSGDAPLAPFNDGHGYVSSIKVLNRIRDRLRDVSDYYKADIKRNQETVRLELLSYDWVYDIVPAVGIVDSNGNTLYYLIPDGKGEWKRTDPRRDQKITTDINNQHSGEFLPVVRLLKYWNKRTTKPVLQPYYFETLVNQVFDYGTKITSYQAAVKYFFDTSWIYLDSSCADPKGLGPNLDADVSADTKRSVKSGMSDAAKHAGYAITYEAQNNHKDAISWWRQVFGPKFPEYGS